MCEDDRLSGDVDKDLVVFVLDCYGALGGVGAGAVAEVVGWEGGGGGR